MPSTQGLERELQETAAIIECTDRQFLPRKTPSEWMLTADEPRLRRG